MNKEPVKKETSVDAQNIGKDTPIIQEDSIAVKGKEIDIILLTTISNSNDLAGFVECTVRLVVLLTRAIFVVLLIGLINGFGFSYLMSKLNKGEEPISYDNIYPGGPSGAQSRGQKSTMPVKAEVAKSRSVKSAKEPNKKELEEANAKAKKK
ncbi:unnamed protein product [Bursaphelenchus okinawaensis]|uniref:Uncharacterized protein n=1 Tax=Bursaphelenchus okinawaensis TaxID=465554 RepID=A0A811LPQ0_9BILA|nr:unnamed protein product [Bursaphelenchus okinawaensis]CAG9125119.1 unnamed protein product [Bursaphelenchus okinawaensis]